MKANRKRLQREFMKFEKACNQYMRGFLGKLSQAIAQNGEAFINLKTGRFVHVPPKLKRSKK